MVETITSAEQSAEIDALLRLASEIINEHDALPRSRPDRRRPDAP